MKTENTNTTKEFYNDNGYNGIELYTIFYISKNPSTTKEQNANKYMRSKTSNKIEEIKNFIAELKSKNLEIVEIINYTGKNITNKF